MNTLFDNEIPLTENAEHIELLRKKYSNYDPYYVVTATQIDRRKIFDEIWNVFEPFADGHFKKQYKHDFHRRTWEMYVGAILFKNGYQIESFDNGPDFLVNKDHYVECVACGNANKNDRGDFVPPVVHGVVQDFPRDQIIMRTTQAITSKYNQYNKWQHIDKTKPYVIAVNSGGFQRSNLGSPPIILQALFGINNWKVKVEREGISTKFTDISVNARKSIPKTINADVPVTYFCDGRFSEISAVIFSVSTVLNHPSIWGSDCYIVKNPFAQTPLKESDYPFLTELDPVNFEAPTFL